MAVRVGQEPKELHMAEELHILDLEELHILDPETEQANRFLLLAQPYILEVLVLLEEFLVESGCQATIGWTLLESDQRWRPGNFLKPTDVRMLLLPSMVSRQHGPAEARASLRLGSVEKRLVGRGSASDRPLPCSSLDLVLAKKHFAGFLSCAARSNRSRCCQYVLDVP